MVGITFNSLELEYGNDFVFIHEGSNASSPIIATLTGYNYQYNEYRSSGNSLFIRFVTNSTNVDNGWNASYAGYQTYCSGQSITTNSGTVTDGSGSNNYQNNQHCEWYFYNYNEDKYVLSFTGFSTEANNDVLYVYDGPTSSSLLLGSFSGSAIPASITTSGQYMTLKFTTNASITSQGWSASFKTINSANCGSSILTGNSDTFSDGSGSSNYKINMSCSWLIKPTNPLNYIVLNFTAFALESCCDYVTIYNGSTTSAPILGSFNGSQLPNLIYSSEKTMLVTFTTDGSATYSGWEAYYFLTTSAPGTCGGTQTITGTSGSFQMEVATIVTPMVWIVLG